MGDWGAGTFDSDDAGEWLDEFKTTDQPIAYLRDTIRSGQDFQCLCAAEIINGVLNGFRDRGLHPSVIECIVGLEPRADEVAKLTRKVVLKVRAIAEGDSELYRARMEGKFPSTEWLANVRDLLNRLEGN